MNTLKTLLCFVFLLAAPMIFGQKKDIQDSSNKSVRIIELLNKYNEYGLFNGSALVAEKGEIIVKQGWGFANMEWNISNQPDTKHRLGSITKQFTALLIMQLVEQGKLELDVPISTYLNDYPKPNGDLITIHHLLTHTSGIPNYTSFNNFFKNSKENYSPTEFIKLFADSCLQFKPGEKLDYSNSGYYLLGAIIERATNKSYEQVLKENILEPLNMHNTGCDHYSEILKNRASGYEKTGSQFVNAPYLDMSVTYAAGSLYSTVEDLYLWDQALYSTKLINKQSMELLFNKHASISPTTHYGYGWTIGGYGDDSITIISHAGGINGFNSLISRIPKDKNLVVLLNNTGGTVLNEISTGILNILYNKPYGMPKKSLANLLVDSLQKQDISKTIKLFHKLKNDSLYSINEYEINSIGYKLLQSGKVKEAIEVFKLNVEIFPNSGNVYDSLGEAYMLYGNKELAIYNYKKSIELNPNNQTGKKVLEKLLSN